MARTRRRPARTLPASVALALVTALVTSVGGPATGASAAPDSAASGRLTVYVSATDGDDGNSGGRQDPFRTITAARDALAGRTSAEARGTVYIRGGTYVLDDTIRLAGPENSWVTYAAYRNEKVTITGSHELPADGWKRLTDLSAETLAQPRYSSNTRLDTPELREGVWVYDLAAQGIDPGTLYKDNSWVLQSRFNSFLDVREGEKYSATPETVAAWHEHYTSGESTYSDGKPIAYPQVARWYVPRVTATGRDCTAADYSTAGTNGCSRATVWDDADSVYVPSGVEIDHAVVVGGGSGFAETTAAFAQPAAEYNLSRWSDKVNTHALSAASVADTGLDLGTLKFSGSGAVAEAYGSAWIAEWNRHVTSKGIGRP